jgi:hypothetical protein
MKETMILLRVMVIIGLMICSLVNYFSGGDVQVSIFYILFAIFLKINTNLDAIK